MEDFIFIYAVTEIIPAYLERFDPERDIFQNVEEQILNEWTFLYNEVEYILKLMKEDQVSLNRQVVAEERGDRHRRPK